jgi:predicted anti-sigma-YlaC factor YlaD
VPESRRLESAHVSGESLDLLLIGALSPAVANAAKAHLDECEACRVRWRELNEDKQRFEEQVYARTLPKVVARSGSHAVLRRRWPPLAWVAVGVTLAAALALGGFLARRSPTPLRPGVSSTLVVPVRGR